MRDVLVGTLNDFSAKTEIMEIKTDLSLDLSISLPTETIEEKLKRFNDSVDKAIKRVGENEHLPNSLKQNIQKNLQKFIPLKIVR